MTIELCTYYKMSREWGSYFRSVEGGETFGAGVLLVGDEE